MAATADKDTDNIEVFRILGVRVHRVTMDAALERVEAFVRSGEPHQIVTADASMIVTAQEDPELRTIIENAALVTPDGAGLLWAARRNKEPLQERVSGVVLAERLCEASAQKGYRVFLFGSAPGVAKQAADRMIEKYPGAQIVGARDGYFKPEQLSTILDEIREAKPNILLVALGIPRQEKFIAKHMASLGVSVAVGVGGSLDVLSGNVRRAPVLFQKLSLEWLWRLLLSPSKISKVKLLPRFVALNLRAKR